MIRLSWRQFRLQPAIAVGILVLLGVLLAITGPTLVHRFHTSGAAACTDTGNCPQSADAFTNSFHALQIVVNAALYVVPALIGMFWGAPLVARELETGTYRLAWTQGVSRTRWLVTKLAVVGLATAAAAGLLALAATWWSSPIDAVFDNRLTPSMFGQRGIAPVAYAVVAFALGVFAGVVIRRTVAAMAAALAAFGAVRLVLTYWVRPYLLPRHTFSFSPKLAGLVRPELTSPPAGSWIISTETVNRAGRPIQDGGSLDLGQSIVYRPATHTLSIPGAGTCHGVAAAANGPFTQSGKQGILACIQHLGVHQQFSYLPAGDYWPLQGIESAICLVLAAALGAASLWWLRHRIA